MAVLRLKGEGRDEGLFVRFPLAAQCPHKGHEIPLTPSSLYRLGVGARSIKCPVQGSPVGLREQPRCSPAPTPKPPGDPEVREES